jgi:glutathione synthase/RimK-type ligase-like ATP-grasp enzyme
MKRVFLVSCFLLKDEDRESIILKEALNKRRIETSIVYWEDPDIDWSEADLTISRTTSSYLFDHENFLNWAKKVEKTSTLWNPSQVMEWNHHKRYIMELQENGIPVPDTILIPQDTDKPFKTILEEIPWDKFVLKPCIGAGSGGLKRFSKDSPDLESHFMNLNRNGFHIDYPGLGRLDFIQCDTLVQPYLSMITQNGEASLIYYGGEFSHSVIKYVRAGDFRAHPGWGAEVLMYDALPEEIEVGHNVLEAVGYPTEYARLDMIPNEDGPIVIEVELIDPMMFFDHLPETALAYADYIENFLNNP